jgi:MFS family permease
VEFNFLARTTEQFPNAVQFQAFYGSYKAILTMVALPLQLFIASRLLEKIGLKNAFFAFPSVLSIGSLMAAIFPGFASAVGMSFSSRITLNALEGPARKSVQGLIPDAKRGRVSTFLDSYVYAIGTIVGCLLLEFFILLSQFDVTTTTTAIILYQSLGVAISLVTIFFIFRLRKSYDESLWHPSLARRKRRSVASDLLGDL